MNISIETLPRLRLSMSNEEAVRLYECMVDAIQTASDSGETNDFAQDLLKQLEVYLF